MLLTLKVFFHRFRKVYFVECMAGCGVETMGEVDAHMLSSCLGDIGNSAASHVKKGRVRGNFRCALLPMVFDLAYTLTDQKWKNKAANRRGEWELDLIII